MDYDFSFPGVNLKLWIIFQFKSVMTVTSLNGVVDSAGREAAQDYDRFHVTIAGKVNILTFNVMVCLITTEANTLKDPSLSELRPCSLNSR